MNYITDYKGCAIKVSTLGQFRTSIPGVADELEADSLASLKKKIDNVKKKGFKRIPFIRVNVLNATDVKKELGEITSITDNQIWLSVGGERDNQRRYAFHTSFTEDEYLDRLYLADTPENREKVDAYMKLVAQADEIIGKARKLLVGLTPVSLPKEKEQ